METFNFKETMPVPAQVRISMSQNIIDDCEPLVKVGDHVRVGQDIGLDKKFPDMPIYSSVSGTVAAIESYQMASGLTSNTVLIDTDGKQEPSADLGAPKISSKEDLVKAIRKSGTIGTAGAAFLNHVNMDDLLSGKIDTLIINGTEYNRYSDLERHMILENSDNIIKTISCMDRFLDIKKYYICLDSSEKDAAAKMKYETRHNDLYNVDVVTLADDCPPGSDRVILYETTGEIAPPSSLVEDLGVAVTNINSMYYIGEYLRTGMPLVSKRLVVKGSAYRKEKEIIAPLGASIADISDFCGGYTSKPQKMYLGGAMLGRHIDSDKYPLEKNNNLILAYLEDHPGLREEIDCEDCKRCQHVCPEGLLPHKLYEAFENKDIATLKKLDIEKCSSCGRCSFVCPARKPLTFLHDVAKSYVRE